jgi:hypothetical protein
LGVGLLCPGSIGRKTTNRELCTIRSQRAMEGSQRIDTKRKNHTICPVFHHPRKPSPPNRLTMSSNSISSASNHTLPTNLTFLHHSLNTLLFFPTTARHSALHFGPFFFAHGEDQAGLLRRVVEGKGREGVCN